MKFRKVSLTLLDNKNHLMTKYIKIYNRKINSITENFSSGGKQEFELQKM